MNTVLEIWRNGNLPMGIIIAILLLIEGGVISLFLIGALVEAVRFLKSKRK